MGETTGVERLRELGREQEERSWSTVGKVRGRLMLEIADQIEDERLRERLAVGRVASEMELHCLGVEGMEDSPVARWARELREALGCADEADEDREAAKWVCDHGGLEAVRRMFQDADNRRVELCGALGIDLDKGWSEAMAAMRFRLMPEGMKWPKFDDGEQVRIGDDAQVPLGGSITVEAIEFSCGKVCVKDAEDGDWSTSSYAMHPLRRPAPKVLAADGEPLEVGQAVWDVDGHGPLVVMALPSKGEQLVVLDNGGTNFYRYSEKLTHERPDSWERLEEDAEGIRRDIAMHLGDYSQSDFEEPGDSVQSRVVDLVRRCKALAEREKGE